MLHNKRNLLLVLLLILTTAEFYHCQTSAKKEIVVTFINAECVDTTYTTSTRDVRSRDPRALYIISKFLVYELNITLKINGESFIYNDPLSLTCHSPDGTIHSIIINEELDELVYNNFYEYKMLIQTKTNGWAKITIDELNDHNLKTDQSSDITFLDNSVYLE